MVIGEGKNLMLAGKLGENDYISGILSRPRENFILGR